MDSQCKHYAKALSIFLNSSQSTTSDEPGFPLTPVSWLDMGNFTH
jgi:hypothetical protein